MHILIAEKSLIGRRILSRLLKLEGHEVSIAESGSHALHLLKETRPEIVLLNVFQCMYSSDETQPGKISVSVSDSGDEAMPVVLVTSSRGGSNLAEFMSPNNQYCEAAFDLLPTKVKSGIMDRIQQMCSALKQSSRFSLPEERFNWQRFSVLMGWTPTPGELPGMAAMRPDNWTGIPANGGSAPGIRMSNA